MLGSTRKDRRGFLVLCSAHTIQSSARLQLLAFKELLVKPPVPEKWVELLFGVLCCLVGLFGVSWWINSQLSILL